MDKKLEDFRPVLTQLEHQAAQRYGYEGYAFGLHSSRLSALWHDEHPCVYLTTARGTSVPLSWKLLKGVESVLYFAGLHELRGVLLADPGEVGTETPLSRVRFEGLALPQGLAIRCEAEWWVEVETRAFMPFWTYRRPPGWPR